MTTNQTIDGVPRELLASFAAYVQDSPNAIMRARVKELRALLDSPASVDSLVGPAAGGMVWHECAVCHVKGSYHPDVTWCVCGRLFDELVAQPHGVPVVLMELVDNKTYGGMHIAKWDNPGGLQEGFHRLYVEQPAPVAAPEKYDDVLLPFLALMRAELHANAHKGDRPGWLQMDGKTATLEVFYHMGKLHQAVHRREEAAIKEYAADVANCCMMLLDIIGGLESA